MTVTQQQIEERLKQGPISIDERIKMGRAPQEAVNAWKAKQQDPYVTLGNLAREKYQKFKDTGIPLENKHIEDVRREGASFKQDKAAALGRNSAIQALGPIQTSGGVGPNQMLSALDRRRSVLSDSASQAAIGGANAQQTGALQKKVGLVQLGRGIQSKGSQMMVNQTSMDIGRRIAERNAASAARDARSGMAGSIIGAGVGAYGHKKDWW